MDTTKNRAAASDAAQPTPRRRLPLASVEDVRREMARLYRSAKAGDRDVGEASKLGYMLNLLARMIDASDLETRIEALETAQATPQTSGGRPAWPAH